MPASGQAPHDPPHLERRGSVPADAPARRRVPSADASRRRLSTRWVLAQWRHPSAAPREARHGSPAMGDRLRDPPCPQASRRVVRTLAATLPLAAKRTGEGARTECWLVRPSGRTPVKARSSASAAGRDRPETGRPGQSHRRHAALGSPLWGQGRRGVGGSPMKAEHLGGVVLDATRRCCTGSAQIGGSYIVAEKLRCMGHRRAAGHTLTAHKARSVQSTHAAKQADRRRA